MTEARRMASRAAAKAWVAGAIAALAFAAPVVDDGVSPSEGLGLVAAFLVAFQGVYWTTNRAA